MNIALYKTNAEEPMRRLCFCHVFMFWLSGCEDMIAEEARLTGKKIEPEGRELDLLNQKLELIADVIRPDLVIRFAVAVLFPQKPLFLQSFSA